MITLNDFVNEQLQDSVFKEKYDALEPEFTVAQTMIDEADTYAETTTERMSHEDVFGKLRRHISDCL